MVDSALSRLPSSRPGLAPQVTELASGSFIDSSFRDLIRTSVPALSFLFASLRLFPRVASDCHSQSCTLAARHAVSLSCSLAAQFLAECQPNLPCALSSALRNLASSSQSQNVGPVMPVTTVLSLHHSVQGKSFLMRLGVFAEFLQVLVAEKSSHQSCTDYAGDHTLLGSLMNVIKAPTY